MSKPGIELVTFGCRLNGVESDAMAREAAAAGHGNLTIVNTCAVTAEASRQAGQAIRRARRLRPDARIVVTGCATETEPARFRAMPEIDAILPNATKGQPATWRALPLSSPAVSRPNPALPPAQTRGFVEVQNGCDHRCTFCIIPFGRGDSRSVPGDIVMARVRALVEAGCKEVVLTGVDLTSYTDEDGPAALGRLVRRILAEVPTLPRLRLSSLDCIEIDPVLMACIADEPRLMPHLHLSIQSGSDLTLKRMKRRHRRVDVERFCSGLRHVRPDIVFGADVIAGFPTETEAMFRETCALIEDCDIAYVHAFPYSPRPGTPAARMPGVAGEVVAARAAQLRGTGELLLRRHLDRQIGRTLTILSERGDAGHAEDFCRVRLPPGTAPGQILTTNATAHDGRSLTVALASQPCGKHTAQ